MQQVVFVTSPPKRGSALLRIFGWLFVVFVIVPMVLIFTIAIFSVKSAITAASNQAPTASVRPIKRQSLGEPTPKPQSLKEQINKALSIEEWSFEKTGFETIMDANFKIKNASRHAVKDITIQCDHTAPSGTVIDHNIRTIYEIIPAGETRTLKISMGFIHSQVKSSGAYIKDFDIVE